MRNAIVAWVGGGGFARRVLATRQMLIAFSRFLLSGNAQRQSHIYSLDERVVTFEGA